MIIPYRFSLPLTAALALLASACGGPKGDEPSSGPTSGAVMSQPAAEADMPAAADTLAANDPAAPIPVQSPAQTSGLPRTPGPISCSADVGEAGARTLAAQCRAVSPATRPPCNTANSCAMIRNEIARSCALIGEDAAKTAGCAIDPISREAAADLVHRFYSAINAHDYASAWGLWGPDGNPNQPLDEFTKGYANTVRTHVDIGKVSDVEGGAGSIYVTVPVTVNAELANGNRQRFIGSYDLRQINRGMGPSQGWHITTAKLQPS